MSRERINNLVSDLWLTLVTRSDLRPAESKLLEHLEKMVTAADEVRASGSNIEAALAALRRRQARLKQESEGPLVIFGTDGLFDLIPEVVDRLGDPTNQA